MLICCQHFRAGNSEEKKKRGSSKQSPALKKKKFPGLVNNHRINVHLSIILNALSKEDNLGVFKHHHLLSEFVMT